MVVIDEANVHVCAAVPRYKIEKMHYIAFVIFKKDKQYFYSAHSID